MTKTKIELECETCHSTNRVVRMVIRGEEIGICTDCLADELAHKIAIKAAKELERMRNE